MTETRDAVFVGMELSSGECSVGILRGLWSTFQVM
jgi:hypothetical protein